MAEPVSPVTVVRIWVDAEGWHVEDYATSLGIQITRELMQEDLAGMTRPAGYSGAKGGVDA